MRFSKVLGSVFVLMMTVVLCSEVVGQNAEQLTKEFLGEAPAQKRSPAQLEAAYDKVVDALLPRLGGDDLREQKKAEHTLERMCRRAGRPGTGKDRAAVCKVLATRLGTDIPKKAKLAMLMQTEQVGGKESVDILTKMMTASDSLIRERARRAMQVNPTSAASQALRSLLTKTKSPEWKVAIINAIGQRQDTKAVSDLVKLAGSGNEDLRCAAVQALARIGDKAAIKPVKRAMTSGSSRSRAIATNACLALADRLVDNGEDAAALPIYKGLLDKSKHYKCAAIIGVARAGGVKEMDRIFKALGDEKPDIRGAAATALGMLPAKDVAKAITTQLKSSPPATKVMLLRALSKRGAKASIASFIAATGDDNESVRMAAYEAMGKLRDPGAADCLTKALMNVKSDAEAEAIASAISKIPGDEMTQALAAALPKADSGGKIRLIEALVDRRTPEVVPAFIKNATDDNAKVRSAAYKAIGAVADADSMPSVIKLMLNPKEQRDRKAAEKAIISIAERIKDEDARLKPLLNSLRGASPANRCSLLRVLGGIEGAKALAAVRKASKDANDDVRDVAIRELTKWETGEVAEDLINLAKTSDNKVHRVLALRGFVRVAGKVSGKTPAQMMKLYQDAFAAAKSTAEKKTVMSGIAKVNNISALKIAAEYMDDPALKAEATIAAVNIGAAVCSAYPDDAEAVLKKALENTKDKSLRKKAGAALDMLDEVSGYIIAWEVSAPYTGGDLFDKEFPPEKPGAKNVSWQIMPMGTDKDAPYIAQLSDASFSGKNRVAYLRTNVWSPAKKNVRLELGSDDGVKVWLNGKVIHKNDTSRGCTPGEDKVNTTLKKGWNKLMLKIVQGSGDWAACAKFANRDGSRIEDLRHSIDTE